MRLKNPVHQEFLGRMGFVHFRFLDQTTVLSLKALFNRFKDAHRFNGRYHHTTFHLGDEELAKSVDVEIYDVLRPHIEAVFTDFRPFIANFMVKESGGEVSKVKLHQDWTYVDETRFVSGNLWIPLQDVDAGNGCLHFLPGSHLLSKQLRPSPDYPELFGKVLPLAHEHLVEVPMKAGEALVFYHNTLHGSSPNVSGDRRINVVQGLMSAQAGLRHCFHPEGSGRVDVYDISIEDFYRLSEKNGFNHISPSFYEYVDFHQISEREFSRLYPGPVVKG